MMLALHGDERMALVMLSGDSYASLELGWPFKASVRYLPSCVHENRERPYAEEGPAAYATSAAKARTQRRLPLRCAPALFKQTEKWNVPLTAVRNEPKKTE